MVVYSDTFDNLFLVGLRARVVSHNMEHSSSEGTSTSLPWSLLFIYSFARQEGGSNLFGSPSPFPFGDPYKFWCRTPLLVAVLDVDKVGMFNITPVPPQMRGSSILTLVGCMSSTRIVSDCFTPLRFQLRLSSRDPQFSTKRARSTRSRRRMGMVAGSNTWWAPLLCVVTLQVLSCAAANRCLAPSPLCHRVHQYQML